MHQPECQSHNPGSIGGNPAQAAVQMNDLGRHKYDTQCDGCFYGRLGNMNQTQSRR